MAPPSNTLVHRDIQDFDLHSRQFQIASDSEVQGTRKVRLALINLFGVFSSLLLELFGHEFDTTKISVTSLIQVQAF